MLENITAYLNPISEDPSEAHADDIWYLEIEFSGEKPRQHITAMKGNQTPAEIARDLRLLADDIEAERGNNTLQ